MKNLKITFLAAVFMIGAASCDKFDELEVQCDEIQCEDATCEEDLNCSVDDTPDVGQDSTVVDDLIQN